MNIALNLIPPLIFAALYVAVRWLVRSIADAATSQPIGEGGREEVVEGKARLYLVENGDGKPTALFPIRD